jgi:hypothetical protein
MCTEGLNLNSAVMPQAGQVTDSAIFMVSICASASWRHWRQFTMSSPSALPMNAKDSESKRGIINSSVPSFFCVLYQQTEGIAHQSAGMRVLVAPFAAGVPLRMLAAPGIVAATAEARRMRPQNAHPVPSGKCGFADCQCWRNWER